MGEVADLFVRLSANTKGFTGAMAGAAAEGEKFSATVRRGAQGVAAFGVIGGAALIGIGAKAIDMGMKFEAATERICTQAGATQVEVNNQRVAMIKMAGEVGFSTMQLAESYYHVESAGYRAAQATDIVRKASELAKIGQSDLAETTNAVVGILQSGWVTGANSAGKAVGLLNAIVGAGNMKMQDLVGAMSTGIAAASKTFGVSMQSSGAAIALMTDQGVPAQMAATHLRMAISLLGAPTKAATTYLRAMGISSADAGKSVSATQLMLQKAGVQTTQLANDMRKPDGFLVALQDLKTHMVKAGISAAEQSAVISRSFGGGKSGAAIMQMYTNLDLLRSKFKQIGAGAGQFSADWNATQNTLQNQVDKTKGHISGMMTAIGMALNGPAKSGLKALNNAFDYLGKHTEVAKAIGAAFAGVIATGLAMAAVAAWGFVAPFLMVAVPIAAVSVAVYELYEKCKPFRDIVQEIGKKLITAFHTGVEAVRDFIKGFEDGGVTQGLGQWQSDIARIGGIVKTVFETSKRFIMAFTKEVIHLWETSKPFWIAIIAVGVAVAALVAPFITVTVAIIYLWNKCAWFRDTVKAIWNAIHDATVTAWNAIGVAVKWFVDGPLKYVQSLMKIFATFWNAHGQELITIAKFVWGVIQRVITSVWIIIQNLLKIGLTVLTALWKFAWDLILNVVKTVWNTIAAGIKSAVTLVLDVIGTFADLLTGHWSKLWGDVKKLVGDTFKGIVDIISNFGSGAINLLWQAGADLIHGLIGGIKSAIGGVKDTLVGLTKNLVSWKGPPATDKVLLYNAGQTIIGGLQAGMESQYGAVQSSLSGFTTGISRAAHHAHAAAVKAANAVKHKQHQALVAHHKAIGRELSGEGKSLTAESKRDALLASFIHAKAHHNKAGHAAAAAMFAKDFAGALATSKVAHKIASQVGHDKNATASEKARAAANAARADRMVASLEKLRLSMDKMTTATVAHHKAQQVIAGRVVSAHGRRLGSRQALAEDLPSYLSAMVGAGRASSLSVAGLDAPLRQGGRAYVPKPTQIHVHVVMPVQVKLGNHVIHKEIQKSVIRHENRNVNNGLSKHGRR